MFMYVAVNLNSFLMAFQEYGIGTNGYQIAFAGWDNFKVAIQFLKDCGYMIENSLIVYVTNTLVGMTFALVFSFYIYKKYSGSGFFRTILFMPQIISSMVFSLLFKYFITDVYTWAVFQLTGEKVLGLLDGSIDVKFITLLVYHVWIGFGVRTLMFSNGMSGIDESIVESAQLDGANTVEEFIYITLPMIYPTIVSFFILGLATLFTEQMHLFGMYGAHAKEVGTLGYYLYTQTLTADVIAQGGYYSYGQLSAVGLILTAIVIPLVLGTKRLMQKLGPSVD
jgi:ABC-type sugar transport system permease subunit